MVRAIPINNRRPEIARRLKTEIQE